MIHGKAFLSIVKLPSDDAPWKRKAVITCALHKKFAFERSRSKIKSTGFATTADFEMMALLQNSLICGHSFMLP